LGDAWTLRKRTKVARCILVSHEFGWELRLIVRVVLRLSQVCRSREEVHNTPKAWKAAMIGSGWLCAASV
jgi:hypothetical protein